MKRSFALVAVTALSAFGGTRAAAAPYYTAQHSFCNSREGTSSRYVLDGSGAVVTSSDGTPVTHGTEQEIGKDSSQLDCEQSVASAAPTPKPPPPAAAPAEPAVAAAFDPPAGEYAGPQSVALSSTTPGAQIHYTTDGSTPTVESPSYAGPIPVEKTTTLQTVVVASGAPSSAISTATYTIAPPPPPPPSRVAVTNERLELKEIVLFDTGKATIDQRSHSLLDEVAATLKDHPEVKNVRVEGHTDDTGGAATNVKLSQSRAEVVREYLVTHGVAADRLTAKGYGDTRPVASNKTAAGRKTNRRTDFVVAQR